MLAGLSARLAPGGLLIAGFTLRPDRLPIERYDALAQQAGLDLVSRWSTWDRQPFAGATTQCRCIALRLSTGKDPAGRFLSPQG